MDEAPTSPVCAGQGSAALPPADGKCLNRTEVGLASVGFGAGL